MTKQSNTIPKKILLIEDEQTIGNLVVLALEKEGYEVTFVKDGSEGMEAVRTQDFDLVLLDIMLPSMNGMNILENMNEEGILPDLPVIIISNSGEPVEIKRALKLGVRNYLVKVNFKPEEVIEKVNMVFGNEGASSDSEKEGKNKEGEKNNEGQKGHTQKNNEKEGDIILIVEDDEILSGSLWRKLDERGLNPVVAASASEARSTLNGEKPVAVILLDILLPDVNGFDFLSEIKENKKWSDIPVVITSNLGQKEDLKKGKELGAEAYFIKATTLPGEIAEHVAGLVKEN